MMVVLKEVGSDTVPVGGEVIMVMVFRGVIFQWVIPFKILKI